MNELGSSVLSAAALLFFLIDPLGNIPALLAVLKGIDPKRQRLIIARELLLALVVLILFLFAGKPLLNFLQLGQEAVTISGGIILLIIGIRLIFPQASGVMGETPAGEPFLVPIAIPMIAGPSIMAMLILMTQSQPGNMLNWFLALILAWSLAAIILMTAPALMRVLKERGLAAVERLMGMILLMMAVQMLINGFKEIFA
ncbi:MarC family protein [Geofilum sp. OHC36d9]|uniref:MarC family protein n=1 Tax=Geofilum sp. OHC36d9 TaxID=3458413 RepID=UPI00403352AB